MVSTKLQITTIFQKSLLSQTQFMQLERFSTYYYICIRFIQPQLSMNFAYFSCIIRRIQLNFESALVITTEFFIKQWIKKQNLSTSYYYSYANHLGTLARKANMMILWTSRKWYFKCQTSRRSNFLIFSIVIEIV